MAFQFCPGFDVVFRLHKEFGNAFLISKNNRRFEMFIIVINPEPIDDQFRTSRIGKTEMDRVIKALEKEDAVIFPKNSVVIRLNSLTQNPS